MKIQIRKMGIFFNLLKCLDYLFSMSFYVELVKAMRDSF